MVAEWVGVDGIGGIGEAVEAGGDGAAAAGCVGDEAAARCVECTGSSAAAARRPRLRTVLVKFTVMSEKMGFLAPERGPGPRTVVAVGLPRGNSSASSVDGALGSGSQAHSAGSKLRSKVVMLATKNET